MVTRLVNVPGQRGWALLAFRTVVTLAIFTLIFHWLPVEQVWDAMKRTGWPLWLWVLAIFTAGHVLAAYKWCGMVRAASCGLAYPEAIRAHFAGLFANTWLPSIVGGDVVRAAWISRRHGIAVPAVTGILDRLLDLAALTALTAVGALLTGESLQGWIAPALTAFGFVVIAGLVTGPAILRRFRPEILPRRFSTAAERLAEVAGALQERPRPILISFLLSVFIQLGFVGLNYTIARALGIEASFPVWLLAWPLAKIIALVPVSLGGLGVREAALAALLTPFGVTASLAVAQALVWQSILFSCGLAAGSLVLLAGRRSGAR
jgi:uncharacterized protein (TIRG00374 family)